MIQRSFTNSDVALLGPIPTYDGIPVGSDSPLVGARPFRRPPHSGFFSASYSHHPITVIASLAAASRSDDSDFLGGFDINGGNSLLLPNRNLDHAYARVDLGGSYRLRSWLGVYAQADNLTDQQHIAPIGYMSLPTDVRLGLSSSGVGKNRTKGLAPDPSVRRKARSQTKSEGLAKSS